MSDLLPEDDGLERRMRAQARLSMEEAEAQSRILAGRQASLADVLIACIQRGDRVAVTSGSHVVQGRPVHARSDLLSLETQTAMVECHLPLVDEVTITPGHGGSPLAREAESFIARLAMLELAEEVVELITAGAGRLQGRLAGVGRDHVSMVDGAGNRTLVPIARVALVIRPHHRP